MEINEARLVQYRVLADHRLHFGRLYFQVIGLNLALVTAVLTAVAISRSLWFAAAGLLMGPILLGTALVAHCLHAQEESYASALRAIEQQEPKMVALPGPKTLGARRLVVVALAAAGLLLISLSVFYVAEGPECDTQAKTSAAGKRPLVSLCTNEALFCDVNS